MSRFSRRNWWVPLLAAKALKAGPGTLSVGTGLPGETAFEFIASVSQNGSYFSVTGYLTAVAGLAEAMLFTDPVIRSQTTARFTFSATANLVSRNVLGVMFVLDEAGSFTISYSEAANGMPTNIASGSMTLQTSVQVTSAFAGSQSPGKGNFRANGELVRTANQSFTLGGISYEFGDANQPWLLTAAGDGTLTDPNTPVSSIVLGGSSVVGPPPATPRR
jgi:hypothetical protein